MDKDLNSDDEGGDIDPVRRVVSAAYEDNLTRQHLESAQVVLPPASEDEISTAALIDHFSDLIADRWPAPATVEDLNEILETVLENLTDNRITTTTSLSEPTDRDFDQSDDIPPLPGAPPNDICRCKSAQSGNDNVRAVRGKLTLRLHFFHGSGNIEIRTTEGDTTRGDVIAMESIYSLWMTEDTVNMVLSCPTTARKLKDGRWREASELSMFPSNSPVIKIKLCQDKDVECASTAVATCRRMHADILPQPTRVPQAFADDELTRRAAEYRAKTVYSRVPPHIRAMITLSDPTVSEDERASASTLVEQLVSYCNKHWCLYVDTILRKNRKHGFPAVCCSCGDATRWHASSGLRLGTDKKDHQYCKRFTSSILPSMKKMLTLPTIENIWRKIRKTYDAGDVTCLSIRIQHACA